jgi:hypothetical protein
MIPPVGMTILFRCQNLGVKINLSSRPERSEVEGPAVSFPSASSHAASKAARPRSTFTARLKPCLSYKALFRKPVKPLLNQVDGAEQTRGYRVHLVQVLHLESIAVLRDQRFVVVGRLRSPGIDRSVVNVNLNPVPA